MRTSRGDIYVELFPESAPRNVANFIALAQAQITLFDATSAQEVTPHYYDGKGFNRVLRNYVVQAGAPANEFAPRPEYFIDDEINGLALGLNDTPIFDDTGKPNDWLNLQDREDFETQLLAPLYERLNIASPTDVELRQFEIHSALRAMTLRQAYESQGYRYNDRLTARPPIRGSIAMASAGPNMNRAEFFFLLVDAPWLAGKATIIGEVVEGMEIVDRIDQSAVLRGDTTAPTPTTATLIFDVRQINAAPSQ
jgi:cyclophilin family peptidyl-prolyl cis-trans isomerase